jgi:hypothetical protein
MRKSLSILFAVLILIAGMHPTVSTHYCAGSIAAVKWSFSGQQASCGMISDSQESSTGASLASSCCHNENAVYAVDSNFSPSSFHVESIPHFTSLMYFLPVTHTAAELIASASTIIAESPPGVLYAGSVSLSGLCTFRI